MERLAAKNGWTYTRARKYWTWLGRSNMQCKFGEKIEESVVWFSRSGHPMPARGILPLPFDLAQDAEPLLCPPPPPDTLNPVRAFIDPVPSWQRTKGTGLYTGRVF